MLKQQQWQRYLGKPRWVPHDICCVAPDKEGCVYGCKVPKRNPAVVQNIEQLQGMASNQQEQYNSLQMQLSAVQDTQQSLEQQLQEATQVCVCNVCWYICTSSPFYSWPSVAGYLMGFCHSIHFCGFIPVNSVHSSAVCITVDCSTAARLQNIVTCCLLLSKLSCPQNLERCIVEHQIVPVFGTWTGKSKQCAKN